MTGNIKIFDCHVHSNLSTDSVMAAVDACERAKNEGLSGIIFTEHLDIDFPGYEDEYYIDFGKYKAQILKLKEQFKDYLDIRMGIEAGYQYHVNEETEAYIGEHLDDFDIIINSTHIVKGMDPYLPEYYVGKDKTEAYGDTLDKILESVTNVINYDVMGHIEFVTRTAPYNDRILKYTDFPDIIDEIFKTLIQKGKGIELNFGNLRIRKNIKGSFSFDKKVYRRFLELGGEIVTIGSDAHKTEHISYKLYNDAFAFLEECGFRYYTHYIKRKPIFEKI